MLRYGNSVDLTKSFPPHPSEDILEEYVFGRLPEALTAQVEEHLLICHSCQDAVEQTDKFISSMKVAERHPVPVAGLLDSGWRRAAPGASVTAVLAVAIVVGLAVWKPSVGSFPGPVDVSLSSLRGFNALSQAPAGRSLQLGIDAPGLTPGKQYRVEVVDATGREVWKGPVAEANNELVAAMTTPLNAGVYWVRLYGGDSELLREFGMFVN
jgi:hypothetical protein